MSRTARRSPARLATGSRCLAAAALLALAAGAVRGAGRAHEHGVARADLAVDAGRIAIVLDTPLENLLGFERAPRSDAERRQVEAALAKLRDAAALWRTDPAAQCTPSAAVVLGAPALGLGADAATRGADGAGHSDLEAEYAFACKAGTPAWISTTLFDAFPRLRRIDVQLAAPKGQAMRTLERGAPRVQIPR